MVKGMGFERVWTGLDDYHNWEGNRLGPVEDPGFDGNGLVTTHNNNNHHPSTKPSSSFSEEAESLSCKSEGGEARCAAIIFRLLEFFLTPFSQKTFRSEVRFRVWRINFPGKVVSSVVTVRAVRYP